MINLFVVFGEGVLHLFDWSLNFFFRLNFWCGDGGVLGGVCKNKSRLPVINCCADRCRGGSVWLRRAVGFIVSLHFPYGVLYPIIDVPQKKNLSL